MRALALVFLLLGCKSDPTPSPAPVPAPVKEPHLAFVVAGEGAVDTLVRDQMARANGKRVLVYVGASWCEPCRRFHDAALAGQLDKTLPPLQFLEFDLDHDEQRLGAAGYGSKWIPLFAVPGPDGRATGKQIAGSIKGDGAVAEISPRLLQLLGSTGPSAP